MYLHFPYGRIYKPGGGLARKGGISPVKKSGALAGRLGVRPGTAENMGVGTKKSLDQLCHMFSCRLSRDCRRR